MEHIIGTASLQRNRIVGSLTIGGSVAALIATALAPEHSDRAVHSRGDALAIIAASRAHPVVWLVDGLLFITAFVVLAVLFPVLAGSLRERGRRFAVAAAVLGSVGAACSAIVNVYVWFYPYAAMRSGLDDDAMARVLIAAERHHPTLAVFVFGSAPLVVANLLIGIALWRSRWVPRIVALAFPVGFLLLSFSGASGLIGVVAGLPWVAASIYLGLRLIRTAVEPSVVRGRTLADVCGIALLLLYVGAALVPRGLDEHLTDRRAALAALAAAQPAAARLSVSGVLVVLGLLGVAALFPILARTVTRRGHRAATVGAVLGVAGAVCGAAVNVFTQICMAVLASSSQSRADSARFLVAAQHHSPAWAVFAGGFLIGLPLALILLGIGLWRGGLVPGWLAAVLSIGGVGSLIIAPTGPIAIVCGIPFVGAVGYVLYRHVWRAASTPAS